MEPGSCPDPHHPHLHGQHGQPAQQHGPGQGHPHRQAGQVHRPAAGQVLQVHRPAGLGECRDWQILGGDEGDRRKTSHGFVKFEEEFFSLIEKVLNKFSKFSVNLSNFMSLILYVVLVPHCLHFR